MTERLFTAEEVIQIANETSDNQGNLYRIDFINRMKHEAELEEEVPESAPVEEPTRYSLILRYLRHSKSQQIDILKKLGVEYQPTSENRYDVGPGLEEIREKGLVDKFFELVLELKP